MTFTTTHPRYIDPAAPNACYVVRYRYLTPPRSGPAKDSTTLDWRPCKGDTLGTPKGPALITGVSRAKVAA